MYDLSPRTIVHRPPTAERWLVGSPDLVYRGQSYRLAEPLRSEGASIRPALADLRCEHCSRVLSMRRHAVRMPDRVTWACIPCGVTAGLLVRWSEAAERARMQP